MSDNRISEESHRVQESYFLHKSSCLERRDLHSLLSVLVQDWHQPPGF